MHRWRHRSPAQLLPCEAPPWTNLISITDGQIVLDTRLFHEGQKPPVDVGTSVSRVGGKTQAPALRAVTGTLRLDYAQFLELEMFTRFGGMSDGRVKAQIARGERLRALLSQPQFTPLRLVDEVALVLALREGQLDHLAPAAVGPVRDALPAWLDQQVPALVQDLERRRQLDDRAEAILREALSKLAAREATR